jgi:glycosyltransferase involved in cell wall biosynthesis
MLQRMRAHACARRTLRIYNGVDPQDWHSSVSGTETAVTVVGCAARLVTGKGVDHLIEAVALALDDTPIRLLVAGVGPDRQRLYALAQKRGAASAITFLGPVSDIRSFWNKCSIAVTPSHGFTESFSMSTLEAMACGKAVVATRNGGVPELVVDGVSGTLVAPGDISALRDALIRYATDPTRRFRHGATARERADRVFHIRDTARQYLKLFQELRSG